MNKFLIAFVCLFAASNALVINSQEWDEYKVSYRKIFNNYLYNK